MTSEGTQLEVLTPSYAPDFELCRDLIESVARFAPRGTVHRVIVPAKDLMLFNELAGGTVIVQRVDDLLPRYFVKVPRMNYWINVRAPWIPVRGWMVQQLVKLAAAASSTADAVLLVDSDVSFIRPFAISDYAKSRVLSVYRLEGGVHTGMSRHIMWDRVARRLLGLPPSGEPAKQDYICCPCLWRPEVVRSLLEGISTVSGREWSTTIGRQLHFSEMVLYGVFVEQLASTKEPVEFVSNMRCANYYEEVPLSAEQMKEFLSGVSPDDLAIMVSAKSETPIEVRREALRSFKA